MRLARFDGGRSALVVGSGEGDSLLEIDAGREALRAADPAAAEALAELLPDGAGSWAAMIDEWERAAPALRGLEALAVEPGGAEALLRPVLDAAVFEPPLPHPCARIFAMGGNFSFHVSGMPESALSDSLREGAAAKPPWGFFVIPGTVVGPETEIVPPVGTKLFDYEAEVGVVLAAAGRSLAAGEVRIWGYTAWSDFSIRDAAFGLSDTDHGPLTWSLVKNFDGANACGPWMVVEEGADPTATRIRCRVNGDLRQDDSTARMTFGYGEIAAHISEYMTLAPGDMILSGTPGGTAIEGGVDGPYLAAGDVVEVEIEGVGTLRNTVGAIA